MKNLHLRLSREGGNPERVSYAHGHLTGYPPACPEPVEGRGYDGGVEINSACYSKSQTSAITGQV